MHFLLSWNLLVCLLSTDFRKSNNKEKNPPPNDCVSEQIALHKRRAAQPAGPRQQQLLVSTGRKPLATAFPRGRELEWKLERSEMPCLDYVEHRHTRRLDFSDWAPILVEMTSFFSIICANVVRWWCWGVVFKVLVLYFPNHKALKPLPLVGLPVQIPHHPSSVFVSLGKTLKPTLLPEDRATLLEWLS